MREIKFRLIKDGKIVGYEKWYPGEKHSPDSGMEGWAAKPHWLYSFDNKAWGIIYIEHDSKKQYIGLKDKGGKECYFGDKVKHDNGDIGFIEWDEGRCGVCFKWPHSKYDITSYPISNADYIDFEVIGNVTENPELSK